MGFSGYFFVNFRSFSNNHQYNFYNKLMWKSPSSILCWDSNPGRHDGRRRRIQWAIAAPQHCTFSLTKMLIPPISYLPLKRSFLWKTNLNYFLNGPARPLLLFIFGLSKQTSLQILQQINVKKSIQYTVPGFEPTTFRTLVSPHYH